jgi:ABC-2 type transport system ATP-binding protein
MNTTLEVRDVRKSYGDFVAVAGVSMEVPAGTIFGLLGPNGAGKTTTIRMSMDIIGPDTGEVLFFGRRRTADDLRRVGYLPEERGLYRKMTVLDHLVFLGELHGLSRSEAKQRSEEWLDRMELGDRSGRKVEELSKGMQQKVQLAGTLIHDPEIVILDEPFSGLDPINQGLFKQVLADYKSRGKTILFSTHVMEQAEKLCDHICLISKGRTVLTGDLVTIKRRESGNSYRLVASGDLSKVEAMPAVTQVLHRAAGDDATGDGPASVKLLLNPGVHGSAVLRELVQWLDVHEFRSEEPDLEEIFIKAVEDAA